MQLRGRGSAEPAAPAYTVVTVRRGNLATTISATGKVQAVTTVQVGTQVSGTVSELHADFNDHVKARQVIARLDPSQIEAQLQQAKANLAAAQAAVGTVRSNSESQAAAVVASKANVDRAASVLLEADRAYKNTVALVEAGVTPARQVEISEAARAQAAAQKAQADAQYDQAVAQAQASKSQLDQALAQATQSKASVDVAAVNLERTIIRAPIDGVVVSRNVDVGQTVAASLQAPTLFLIAQDLTKMQVLADVDEADVGQLSPDSKVSFTVDAFPTETFQGRISANPAVAERRAERGDLYGGHLRGEPEAAVEAGHDGDCDRDRGGEAGCPGSRPMRRCGSGRRHRRSPPSRRPLKPASRVGHAATGQPYTKWKARN